MTLQEMFNKAYLGLAGQKFERSANKQGSCLYRSPDGKKCAVGHLIDDKYYNPDMEYKAAYEPMVLRALEASGVRFPELHDVEESKEQQLLNAMQLAHDGRVFEEGNGDTEIPLKEKLARVAADFNLTVPEIS